MFLETIATSSESTSRVFGISIDQLKTKNIATLLKNQGVYNGLIAVLLLVAVWQQDLLWKSDQQAKHHSETRRFGHLGINV